MTVGSNTVNGTATTGAGNFADGAKLGIDVEIVERNPANTGFVPERIRWVIELTDGLNMLERRLSRDDEHAPSSAEFGIYWASAGRIPRRLVGVPASWRETWMTHPVLQQLLDRIELREQQLAAEAGDLSARLREVEGEREALQITAKTIRARAGDLKFDQPPAPALPDGAAYQQIRGVLEQEQRPLRARDLCLALDLPVLPKHIEGTRAKLKRLVGLGFLDEPEPGLFAQRRPDDAHTRNDQQPRPPSVPAARAADTMRDSHRRS